MSRLFLSGSSTDAPPPRNCLIVLSRALHIMILLFAACTAGDVKQISLPDWFISSPPQVPRYFTTAHQHVVCVRVRVRPDLHYTVGREGKGGEELNLPSVCFWLLKTDKRPALCNQNQA